MQIYLINFLFLCQLNKMNSQISKKSHLRSESAVGQETLTHKQGQNHQIYMHEQPSIDNTSTSFQMEKPNSNQLNNSHKINDKKFVHDESDINRGPEHQFVSVQQVEGQVQVNFSNCQSQSNNSSLLPPEQKRRNDSSEISMIHIKQQNETRDFGQSIDCFQIADDVLNQFEKLNPQDVYKKSDLEVLQAGKRHIPSPLQNRNDQSSFFFKDGDEDSGFEDGSSPSRPSIPNVINDINLYQPVQLRNLPKSQLLASDSYNIADNFFKSPNNDQISDDEMGDSEDDLERMEEDHLEDILMCDQTENTDYQEFLEKENTKMKQSADRPKVFIKNIKLKKHTNDEKFKKYKVQNTSGEHIKNFKTISLPLNALREKHDGSHSPNVSNYPAGTSRHSPLPGQQNSKNKIKLKINNRYSNTGANLMKIESLYQVASNEDVEKFDEKKEIHMDHPRLKIFRFKHLKTSLEDQEQLSGTNKFASQEKTVIERKSSLEVYGEDGSKSRYRGASRKAASRYEPKTDDSNSFDRMSNDNESNQIFYDSKAEHPQQIFANKTQPVGLHTKQSKSPNEHTQIAYNETSALSFGQRQACRTQMKESKSNDKATRIEKIEEDVDDILSNSQISKVHRHKFNIKRFSAALIQDPIPAPATQRFEQMKGQQPEMKPKSKQAFLSYKSKSPLTKRGTKKPSSLQQRECTGPASKVSNDQRKINFKKIEKPEQDKSPNKLRRPQNQPLITQKIKIKQDKTRDIKQRAEVASAEKTHLSNLTNRVKDVVNPKSLVFAQSKDQAQKAKPEIANLKPSAVKYTQSKTQLASQSSMAQSQMSSDIQKQLNKIQEEISMIHQNLPSGSKKKSRDPTSCKKQPPVVKNGKVPKFQSNLMASKKTAEENTGGKTQSINQTKQLRNDFARKVQTSSQKNIQQRTPLFKHHNSSQKQLPVGSGLIEVSKPQNHHGMHHANMTGSLTTQTLSGGPTVGTIGQTNTNSTGSGVQKSRNSDATKKPQQSNLIIRSKSPPGMGSCLLQTPNSQTGKASAAAPQAFAKKTSMVAQKNGTRSQCDKNAQNLRRYLSGSGSSSAGGIYAMQTQQHSGPSYTSNSRQANQKPAINQKLYHQTSSSGAQTPQSNCESRSKPQVAQNSGQPGSKQPKTSARVSSAQMIYSSYERQTYTTPSVQKDGPMSVRSGTRESPSPSQENGNIKSQRSNSRRAKNQHCIPRHTPLAPQQQQKQPSHSKGQIIENPSLSNVANILYNTKEAIQKQKMTSKIENTKKIILKNQQQMLNKQQQIMQKQMQDSSVTGSQKAQQQQKQYTAGTKGLIQVQVRAKNDQASITTLTSSAESQNKSYKST